MAAISRLVNLWKSKIMIINGRKSENAVFLYNDTTLEIVHKNKYLWVIFSDRKNIFQKHITYTQTVLSKQSDFFCTY